MPWNDVIGQTEAVDQMRRLLRAGRIAGSYLILGPEDVGHATVAVEFAKAILCQNSTEEACGKCSICSKVDHGTFIDLVNLRWDPEKSKSGDIVIDQVREILAIASTMPREGDRRVFIIHEADRLTDQAADCMLKTLEEPSNSSVFILYTANADQLPSTIPSRCQKIRLKVAPPDVIADALVVRENLDPERARLLAQMSGGRIERARALMDSDLEEKRRTALEILREARAANDFAGIGSAQALGKNRPEVHQWMRLLISLLRDALLLKSGADPAFLRHSDIRADIEAIFADDQSADIIEYIQAAQQSDSMLDGNVQPAAAFENLLFTLG